MNTIFFNPNYAGDVIHLGGQAFPVNAGVIELSAADLNKWGNQLPIHGFEIKEAKKVAVIKPESVSATEPESSSLTKEEKNA